MKMMKQILVGGCVFLCGCNSLPIDTSHFTPLIQLDYPAQTDAGLLQSQSTRRAPMLPAPAGTVPLDREPKSTTAASLEREPPDDAAPRRAGGVDISEDSSRTSSSAQQDVYRYSADGRTILPPSKSVEVIDISSINKALEADTVDADVLRLEADAAKAGVSSHQAPGNLDPVMVGTVRR